MAVRGFHEFVMELFGGLGPVTIKRFFGGAGVYVDGVMFAMLADDAIHLKTDDALRIDLAAEGSSAFVWIPQSGPRKGQEVEFGYWRLPDSALDDPEEAVRWGRRALDVARRTPVKRPAGVTTAPRNPPRRKPGA